MKHGLGKWNFLYKSYKGNLFLDKFSWNLVSHTAFETVRPQYNGQNFVDDIFKCMVLKNIFWCKFHTVVASTIRFIWHCVRIGLDNALALNWKQTMAWANDDLYHWCISASAVFNLRSDRGVQCCSWRKMLDRPSDHPAGTLGGLH